MVEPRENRVPIMMSNDELQAIDDWRFGNRIATRSDAIRRLCQIGLRFDRQFEALYEETSKLTDLTPQVIDQVQKEMNTPERDAWDVSMGTALLVALANQSEGQKRLLSILFGVLGEAATLRDETATANAIKRTDSAAEEYYASIKETLRPLFTRWEVEK